MIRRLTQGLARLLYSFLMWLAIPLYRARLKRRAVAEPGYLIDVAERFGAYAMPAAEATQLVWVHAVSLGEVRAAQVLVQHLRQSLPGMKLLLTNGTATGRAEGGKLLGTGDVQVWQPWDTPAVVQKFLDHFKPRIGILMETEVWPNLAAMCRQRQLPMVLANARLSEKSLRQSMQLAWLARPAYGALAAAFAQTEADAARLRLLGTQVQGVFGNIKFDANPDAMQLALGRKWRTALPGPVVLFASSREGEELLLLGLLEEKSRVALANIEQSASKKIAFREPSLVQWLIVPRHPQRFDEVADLIVRHGFEVSRRSQWESTAPPVRVSGKPCIWLGDSLGEMSLYYGLADAALLGGSFAPLGGQNLIEAAACGCPVVMGPHTFNFAEAASLAEEAGAARRVDGLAQAIDVALQWVQNEAETAQARQACASFTAAHQGASQKLTQAIVRVLDGKFGKLQKK